MNNTFNNQAEFERTTNLRQQIRTDVSCYISISLVYLLIQHYCCGTLNGRLDYTSRGIDVPGDGSCQTAKSHRENNSDIPQEIVSN